MKKFPNYKQLDSWDCGPTSLKIIAQHFGNKIDIEKIRREIDFERIGVSLNSLEPNTLTGTRYKSDGKKYHNHIYNFF
ncbi:cysteine peptidase family C39 domain-containing protein [uncultured Maribacter sp.]|uniref:cysteine peptidase family C39 domain-containing protein n=1 Tax=uncultured Maribacter sp. TaxID=431308 RepID=UPI0030D9FD69